MCALRSLLTNRFLHRRLKRGEVASSVGRSLVWKQVCRNSVHCSSQIAALRFNLPPCFPTLWCFIVSSLQTYSTRYLWLYDLAVPAHVVWVSNVLCVSQHAPPTKNKVVLSCQSMPKPTVPSALSIDHIDLLMLGRVHARPGINSRQPYQKLGVACQKLRSETHKHPPSLLFPFPPRLTVHKIISILTSSNTSFRSWLSVFHHRSVQGWMT